MPNSSKAEEKVERITLPLPFEMRLANYAKQSGNLTPRQRRRLMHKDRHAFAHQD